MTRRCEREYRLRFGPEAGGFGCLGRTPPSGAHKLDAICRFQQVHGRALEGQFGLNLLACHVAGAGAAEEALERPEALLDNPALLRDQPVERHCQTKLP